MILKNKRYLKLFICLMLSCSLCVSAPLARYQRIESQAAIAVPIAIGAATIALMYLASCGISYVFQNMAQDEAEDWIDTKIIEFSSLSNGNGGTNGSMPNGSGNWKMTALGALMIGSTLSNWLSRFATWIKGSQEDNTSNVLENTLVQTVGNFEKPIFLFGGTTDQIITTNEFDVRYQSSAISYDTFKAVGDRYYVNDSNPEVYYQCNRYESRSLGLDLYFDGVQHGVNQLYNRSTYSSTSYYNEFTILGYIESTSTIYPVVCETKPSDNTVKLRFLANRGFTYDLSDEPINLLGNLINQKTDTVSIPQEIENDHFYTINPDVQTTTQDLNGVPVPLSAEDIADAVWEKISLNTSSTTVYQPELLPAQDGYSEQPDINTDDYDEPLPGPDPDPDPGPDPDPEQQPDWSDMSAGDVPAFTQSVWNYFMQNHNWQQLKQKFPFSLPYDAYLIANIFFDTSYDVMDELPQDGNNNRLIRSSTAPVYTLSVPWGYGDPYTLVLDFSLLDPWQPIIRAAAGVLFTVALIVGVL